MISSHDDVMGVIHLKNKLGGRGFSDEDLPWQRHFAHKQQPPSKTYTCSSIWPNSGVLKVDIPTANNFVFSLDIYGRLEHASHDPKVYFRFGRRFYEERLLS